MKTATAHLDWSLYVECPHCSHDFDLADTDDDNVVAQHIFSNAWKQLEGYEVCCPECDQEFCLDKVDY